MSTKNSKKSKPPPAQDVEALKSDVASFASSIGLSSASTFSGFDDSDFRKKGPLKPLNQKSAHHDKTTSKTTNKPRNIEHKPKKAGPASKGSSFNNFTDLSNNKNSYQNDRFKNLPKLPLVRAKALGTWYIDAEKLEKNVLGDEGKKKQKVVINNLQEWKDLVEKKRQLGERLLAQYVGDYESSRAQSGDIKMLIATQRSGTAVDKVSAFSVMVGDNAVANIRSLDVLLGKEKILISCNSIQFLLFGGLI